MELKIIGLYGPSRSGKDSVAAVLESDFGFKQKAMADGIREILLGLNPIIKDNGGVVWEFLDLYDQCHGDWDKIKAMSSESVDYMIRLGQTCRDVLGETVWLNRVMPPPCECPKIVAMGGKSSGCSCPQIVISDVRQPNEYYAIKERGGQVWRITRPGTTQRGMDGLLDDLDFDFRLFNNGTLEDLRGQVQAVISADIVNSQVKGRGYYGGNYGE